MDKKQAKEIVGQAVKMLKLTYEEHLVIQKALSVLSEDKKEVKKEEKEVKKKSK